MYSFQLNYMNFSKRKTFNSNSDANHEKKTSLLKHDVSKLRSRNFSRIKIAIVFRWCQDIFSINKKKGLKILENMKIYRNTFVFISFTSSTIDVFQEKDAKNRYFCATRAEFTFDSNEHCFSVYFDDWKTIKKI